MKILVFSLLQFVSCKSQVSFSIFIVAFAFAQSSFQLMIPFTQHEVVVLEFSVFGTGRRVFYYVMCYPREVCFCNKRMVSEKLHASRWIVGLTTNFFKQGEIDQHAPCNNCLQTT